MGAGPILATSAALDLARLPERQIWRDKRLAMLVKAKRQAEQTLGE